MLRAFARHATQPEHPRRELVPRPGLEPGSARLEGECSSIEQAGRRAERESNPRTRFCKPRSSQRFGSRAGSGNRTHIGSLENCGPTVERCPPMTVPQGGFETALRSRRKSHHEACWGDVRGSNPPRWIHIPPQSQTSNVTMRGAARTGGLPWSRTTFFRSSGGRYYSTGSQPVPSAGLAPGIARLKGAHPCFLDDEGVRALARNRTGAPSSS